MVLGGTVCLREAPVLLKPLAEGCKIISLPVCKAPHVRPVGYHINPISNPILISRMWTPIFHHNCFCNMYVSARNRVLASVPLCDSNFIKSQLFVMRLIKSFIRAPVARQEATLFYLKYSGAKRKRYSRAAEIYQSNGLSRRNGGVNCFVKPDKINPFEKMLSDPRMIQFRDPVFCVAIAQYLKPLEEKLYHLKLYHPLCYTNSRVVGKGMNQVQRASAAHAKWSSIDDPVCVSLDMSRFDLHVSKELLEFEHYFYLLFFPDSVELRDLLKRQLVNKVSSMYNPNFDKFKYISEGRRMSGDMNTALGNCVLMIAMCFSFFLKFNIRFDLLDDGDDMLTFISRKDLPLLTSEINRHMLSYGMVCKVESVAFEFEKIVWCQCSPVNTYRGWKFVRDPIKVLSTTLSGPRWSCTSTKFVLRSMAAQAICEGVLSTGVPILACYASALARNSLGYEPLFNEASGDYFRFLRESKLYHKHDLNMVITDEARLSFSKAFNIDVDTQLAVECELNSWKFDCSSLFTDYFRFDVTNWSFLNHRYEF